MESLVSHGWRWVLVALLLVVIGFAFSEVRRQLDSVNQAKENAAIRAPVRAWRHLPRVSLVSQSLDVAKVQGWTVGPNPLDGNRNYRCTLRGRFAATEPLWFVVMDPVNSGRMRAGDPPFFAYAVQQASEISTPCAAAGSFYGFVRPEQQIQGVPLTTSQLALQLAARIAESHRPPARVTAELWLDGECFCTESESQAGRVAVN